MKYTKKEVFGMFTRLVKACKAEKENWVLDYAACYGGYVIEKIDENGGVHHPFSSSRRTAKELYLSMLMTAQALENLEYKNKM